MMGRKTIVNLKELKRKVFDLSAEEFSEFQASFEKIEAARQRKQRIRLAKSSGI